MTGHDLIISGSLQKVRPINPSLRADEKLMDEIIKRNEVYFLFIRGVSAVSAQCPYIAFLLWKEQESKRNRYWKRWSMNQRDITCPCLKVGIKWHNLFGILSVCWDLVTTEGITQSIYTIVIIFQLHPCLYRYWHIFVCLLDISNWIQEKINICIYLTYPFPDGKSTLTKYLIGLFCNCIWERRRLCSHQ